MASAKKETTVARLMDEGEGRQEDRDGGMERGAEREVKTEWGQGGREAGSKGGRESGKNRRTGVETKRGGTKGEMDGRTIERHNKQVIPDLMKLPFY